MSDLIEFLLARIAEDERVVRYASVNAHQPTLHLDTNGYPVMDPARVLAECEAKRRIIAALDMTPCPCQRAERCVIHDASAGPPALERYVDPVTDDVLAALALPYADHPDYREEWRP